MRETHKRPKPYSRCVHLMYPFSRSPARVGTVLAVCLVVSAHLAYARNSLRTPRAAAQGDHGKLVLTSSAFQAGSKIPAQYTCQGADTSPPLSWTDPPSRTQSFVLIMDDPDAPSGTWVHWVVYNLPGTVRSLPENVPKQESLPSGGSQGVTSFEKVGYGGPCPPPGNPHRYFFKLYALDAKLSLKPGASKQAVENAMKGHVLAKTELVGNFGR
jgi:Raf kinase inhibitor-like YbhB/YbcL family protein